ncbi:RAD50-interacting protein 1-like [Antedon mediterranea]|uniref:RAD50-interacting protein 1-like n=1 Tax=Antedon mediterranea TaxID=105859 RepID=UPI003AF61689
MQYMKWLALIQQLSSDIQGSLLVNSTPYQFHSVKVQQSISAGAMPSAIKHFVALVEISKLLQDSKCCNLVEFVNSTILFWYNILKEKLSGEFEEVATAVGWPFIANKVASLPQPTATKEDFQSRLDTLFTLLLKLQLPEDLELESKPPSSSSSLAGQKPISLPIELLLKPLIKRFKFHFSGKKQTNNLERPEFYFSQILAWLRDHADFLDNEIQPILDREEMSHVSARMEFCRGLIEVLVSKAESDVQELIFDDQLLSHFIDELLAFETELHVTHSYPPWQPSCINVLTRADCFQRWLAIERNFAVEKIDALLSDPDAWRCQYKDINDGDDLKVPQCAESFVTLLSVITDRYKTVPFPTNQLQFLVLQLDLLDDFRVRLLQVAKQEAYNPLSNVYCAIINSVNYVIRVLEDWSDQLFFLQLQYHHAEDENMAAFNQALESSSANIDINLLSKGLDGEELDAMQSAVFDDIIELYKHMQQDMCRKINTCIFNQLHSKAKLYLKEKWFSLPSVKDLAAQSVTFSACEMLLFVKDNLHLLQEQLCLSLFKICWRLMAEGINKFLYEEMILCNQFNEGGAAQLQFDMARSLFPLFGAYTQRPENYFKEIKEACLLLNLKAGTAILLRDLLFKHLHDNQNEQASQTSTETALHDVGVYRLKKEAAERILNLRTDWPKI